jgi:MFS family permease
MLVLVKETPSLRRFFAVFFESQVGNSAAYVALVLIAYHRLHSGWGISLVLLGEFLPGIALAPLFGSSADRSSRRRMVICSDLLRAGCFHRTGVGPVVRSDGRAGAVGGRAAARCSARPSMPRCLAWSTQSGARS